MTDGQALFDAAAGKLRGDGGPPEPEAARELFRQAAATGRVDAAAIYCNLLAAGIGGPREWAASLRLLASLAEVNTPTVAPASSYIIACSMAVCTPWCRTT